MKFWDKLKIKKRKPQPEKLPLQDNMLLQRFVSFSTWLQLQFQPISRKLDWRLIQTCSVILAISFLIASSVSTFVADKALGLSVPKFSGSALASGRSSLSMDSGLSFSEIKKQIMKRNIFNAEGEVPPEDSETTGKKTVGLDFSGIPCTPEKLPFEVVGTIITQNVAKNLVTIRDQKVTDSDIYKPGDVVIDHEEYEVFRVQRGKVEFRKGDAKICIELQGFESRGVAKADTSGAVSIRPENVETVEFDTNFMTQEIGPGYSNILNSAKMIPDVAGDNKFAGFKLISITPGSLFDRMKLTNGDTITEVNGTSLKDASQGFKLYQSLQEEREITVNILRNGEPMTRKVRVIK